MYKKITLSQGQFALVDAGDVPLVEGISRFFKQGAGQRVGYAAGKVGAHKVYMHRYLLGAKQGEVVDHINGNSLDNRRMNLRLGDQRSNLQNAAKRSVKNQSSRYKGVSWARHANRWSVRIHYQEGVIRLGYFNDEVEAAEAYDAAARMYFGEFARVNFPRKGEQGALNV